MLLILKKIFYILLLLAVNLYICDYAGNKITARMELRRGYRITRLASSGFPVVRFIKDLSSGNKINIWTFYIFIFSFLMWSVVPITAGLVLIDEEYSLFIAVVFYITLLIMLVLNSSRSNYTGVFSENCKKLLMVFSFIAPVLLSILSIILLNKTLSLKEIVNYQHNYWNVVLQPLGFIIFFISMFFQLKLLGIIKKSYVSTGVYGGKEGKGLEKIIERLSIYMIIFFLIIILNVLYLGGWQNFYIIRGEIMVAFKFYLIFVILLFMDKITGRIDNYKLMVRINWKFLIPASVVNFLITLGFFVARDVYNLVLF